MLCANGIFDHQKCIEMENIICIFWYVYKRMDRYVFFRTYICLSEMKLQSSQYKIIVYEFWKNVGTWWNTHVSDEVAFPV